MSASTALLTSPVSFATPYVAYAYAYPHKMAYRSFDRPRPLEEVWRDEARTSLFLYLHIPFCEHRCGFCNLFTQAQPEEGLVARYLQQLREEAVQVRAALGEANFARLALGGGTPTFLAFDELQTVFDIAGDVMGADVRGIPTSVEVSPATIDTDKLQLLNLYAVDRISIGVQSFDDAEAHRLGRPQRRANVVRALDGIRDTGFPTLNIDLIYGGEGQTVASWLASVREALQWRPEELYLYPLYVRPLTGLGRLQHDWDDQRLTAYREARALLLDAGYQQVSMRMFRARHAPEDSGPVYCCQTDGMVGLGCGARSYTGEMHYSTEYAVGRSGVRSILADYVNRAASTFGAARYGYVLPVDDQRRRFVIMSLLQAAGLTRGEYAVRFGDDVLVHFPQLAELLDAELAALASDRLVLTPAGLELSDAIGPWLYSPRVRRLIEKYELR